MKCKNCGNEFNEGVFCPECGTKYEKKNIVDVNTLEKKSQGENTSCDMSNEIAYEGEKIVAKEEKKLLYGILLSIFVIVVMVLLVIGLITIAKYANKENEEVTVQNEVDDDKDDIEKDVVLDDVKTDTKTDEQEHTITQTDEGYILPESSTRYYSYDELSTYDVETLRVARNEIYARHGRIFTSEDLRDYFEMQSWYEGIYSEEEFKEEWLNDYEIKNLDLIKSIENGQDVQEQSAYQDASVNLYETVLSEYIIIYGEHSEYMLWDIDENGTNELILSYGTCNADWKNSVYTICNNEVVCLGDFYGAVCIYDGDYCIYSVYEHMDYTEIECISIYGNELSQEYIEGTVYVGEQLIPTYVNDVSALY